jgi:outer membrane protein assembly factor BamB
MSAMSTQDTVYIGCNGHVCAVRIEDGVEVWRAELKGGFFSVTGHEDVSVLVEGGRVYAGCYGHLFCLDARTGRQIWHNELDGLGHNEVTLAIPGQSVQFVTRTESSRE